MTMTQEERISRLEGAYEVLGTMVENMVTKDELRASVEMLQAQIQGTADTLRAEQRAGGWQATETLRAEQRASVETLQAQILATEEKLRAEMRAMELRIIRWVVGTILAATAIAVTAISVAAAIAIRLLG